ncbi:MULTISPECIES: hypothetical protein [unclassified Nocardia]|uniref:hypothetical protein n=1 Tax=unclassified Nocardia TaxID=2637762 RepID=UPI0035DC17B4
MTKNDPAEAAECVAPQDNSTHSPREISLRLSTVLTAVALAVLTVATIAFGALYLSDRSELRDRDTAAADRAHAERIAMDYALGASTIDYRDTKSWLGKLKSGTSTQLAGKFDATAPQLEQILLPLQWTSKATPIQATVASENAGVYKVNAFIDVNSTSVQTPQGGSVTVAYSVTIDRNADWKITAVGGGLDGALTTK